MAYIQARREEAKEHDEEARERNKEAKERQEVREAQVAQAEAIAKVELRLDSLTKEVQSLS
jgi:hypothetical protein